MGSSLIITIAFTRLFVVAAVATVCQEPHFQRGEGKELVAFLFDPKKFFGFESIAAHDLINSIPGIYGWI